MGGGQGAGAHIMGGGPHIGGGHGGGAQLLAGILGGARIPPMIAAGIPIKRRKYPCMRSRSLRIKRKETEVHRWAARRVVDHRAQALEHSRPAGNPRDHLRHTVRT